MRGIGEDIRFALRTARKRPWFTATAVLTLTLGIGANTAIFSAVNALLIQSPPSLEEPERVVEVGRSYMGRGFDTFSYPDLLALQERAAPLQAAAGWSLITMSMSTGGAGERVDAMLVSANYFNVLGVRPARGRFFLPDEDDPRAPASAVVLSHRLWRDRFGGDPGIVGATFSLNRERVTIVGVAAEGFGGHMSLLQPDLWVPMGMLQAARPGINDLEHVDNNWLMVIARLAPGVTLDQANEAVRSLFDQQRQRFPREYRQKSGRVLPIGPVPGVGRSAVGAFLGVLMAMVGLILLITCANVAGMLLARALNREREIAVRLALGCGRARLVRLLLTESLTLFVAAAGLAAVLTAWLLGLVSKLQLSIPLPVYIDVQPDALVLAAGFGIALATGVTFGLAPALRASRPDLVRSLKQGSSGTGGARSLARAVFVNGQVGLSAALLISAALFLRALQTAGALETGFDPDGVDFVSIDLSIEGYDEQSGRRFVDEITQRLESLPGVRAAATSLDLPLDLAAHGAPVYPEGFETGESGGLGCDHNVVSPEYFEALRIPLLAGRDFAERDGPDAPLTVIVSQTLARRAWPNTNPLGKTIRWGGAEAPARTVVGVVGDVKNQTLTETTGPMLYLPYSQEWRPQLNIIVRGERGATGLPALLSREIRARDPQLALEPARSLEAYTAVGILPQRLAAGISAALGALALLLSAVGVYAVVAQMVARRTREIGIRLALGAKRSDVLALVLRTELFRIAPGLAAGFVLAVGVANLLGSFLLGLNPLDPIAFAGVLALLLLALVLASLSPSLRAAATEPVQALRYD
ncbi:MAG: ABC transporter permease [Gemmatimonadales bacterium]|jgi:predicted permease